MKELTGQELTEWKRIITDVLKAFHNLCRDNNLIYYGSGGTAIGTVRHKGIIPWDDDIDVVMPRPDYDRLIEVCRTTDLHGYELVDPHCKENYPVPFMKFCDKNTTLIEQREIPVVTGLYIDIFPIDGTSDDINEAVRLKRSYEKYWNKLEAISNRSTFAEYLKLLTIPHEWGRFVTKTIGYFFRPWLRGWLLKRLDAISYKYPYETSKNVIVYSGSYGAKEIMPRSVYEGEAVLMPFEDTQIPLASGYEEYLTRIFGDYMQLPPIEQRASHHCHAYVNMKKREYPSSFD